MHVPGKRAPTRRAEKPFSSKCLMYQGSILAERRRTRPPFFKALLNVRAWAEADSPAGSNQSIESMTWFGISMRNPLNKFFVTYHGDGQSTRGYSVDHLVNLIGVYTKAIKCTRRGKPDMCLRRQIGWVASIISVSSRQMKRTVLGMKRTSEKICPGHKGSRNSCRC